MMLVLHRKAGQTIRVGEVTFKIIKVRKHGGGVHLGIDAPRHVRIDRGDDVKEVVDGRVCGV